MRIRIERSTPSPILAGIAQQVEPYDTELKTKLNIPIKFL